MTTRLTYRQRRVLLYEGVAAKKVAAAEHMPLDEVLEVRLELRRRGVVASAPESAPPTCDTQLTFAAFDHLMRANTSSAL